MIIYGKRTYHTTEETKIVELFVEWRFHPSLDMWYLHIVNGGVTGYESISLYDLYKKDVVDVWLANAGTKGRYDTLLISAKWLGIIRKEYQNEYKKMKGAKNADSR